MHQFLKELRNKVAIGIVGGSDLSKITQQMGKEGTNNININILGHLNIILIKYYQYWITLIMFFLKMAWLLIRMANLSKPRYLIYI